MTTTHIENVLEHVEKYCKKRGIRFTSKRKLIFTGLLKSNKALSAYELIEVCEAEFGETISAMTMYRILEFFENEYLVHRLNLANKYIACSHITCDHDHSAPQFLICSECHKVQEVSVNKSTISELNQNVKDSGFQLLTPQLEMNCICNECLNYEK